MRETATFISPVIRGSGFAEGCRELLETTGTAWRYFQPVNIEPMEIYRFGKGIYLELILKIPSPSPREVSIVVNCQLPSLTLLYVR